MRKKLLLIGIIFYLALWGYAEEQKTTYLNPDFIKDLGESAEALISGEEEKAYKLLKCDGENATHSLYMKYIKSDFYIPKDAWEKNREEKKLRKYLYYPSNTSSDTNLKE